MKDPFIRTVLSVLLILVFISFLFPGIFSLLVLYKTSNFQDATSDLITSIGSYFGNFKGLPADTLAALFQAFPGLVAIACWRNSDPRFLSNTGRISVAILLLCILVSIVAVGLINPSDKNQVDNYRPGAEALQHLAAAVQASLKLSVTYFFMLAGIKLDASAN